LSFLIRDIATWPGPDYQRLESQRLDPELLDEQQEIARQRQEIQRQMRDRQTRQNLLRDSTRSSEQTMNQLLEIHRLGLEKNVEPTEAEQQALAEAEQLFLDNQRQYQQLNTQIVQLNEQLTDLDQRERTLQQALDQARRPIIAEFQRRLRWHELRMASFKLALLAPLLVLTALSFVKWRHSIYAPLIYAVGIALAVKIGVVLHQHFPARYFKYILILLALAIVIRILVYLLRMLAHPNRDYLLRQYREAYERFLCPVCSYPIRRGPLKYVFWNRRSIKRLSLPPQLNAQPDEPYRCPACGTQLFEPCPDCGNIRHSLLPVCVHCGNTRQVASPPPPGTGQPVHGV
jgi:hypothetical protein